MLMVPLRQERVTWLPSHWYRVTSRLPPGPDPKHDTDKQYEIDNTKDQTTISLGELAMLVHAVGVKDGHRLWVCAESGRL